VSALPVRRSVERCAFIWIVLGALSLLGGEASGNDSGRMLFEPCRACHALDPGAAAMAGPNLAGLLGRRVAGDPAFDYSPVLRQAGTEGQVWSEERLDRFLTDPEAMFPGMWMTARRMDDAGERQALVRFLADPASR
jgi:cytochrome c